MKIFKSLLFCFLSLTSMHAVVAESFVKTTLVEGQYEEVLSAVKDVIKGRGINIAHTLPAGDMLGRTGISFNIQKSIYKSAETIEFCSAKISHQLAQADPENIVLCPFTISVYVLNSDPEHVRLTTRLPFVSSGSADAVENMRKLVDGIIQEAADW